MDGKGKNASGAGLASYLSALPKTVAAQAQVSDALCAYLVGEALRRGFGVLFENVPRNSKGLRTVRGWLSKAGTGLELNSNTTVFVSLELSEELAFERLRGKGTRLVHSASGRVYHSLLNPPKVYDMAWKYIF